MSTLTVPLRGAGGETIDLWRVLQSHGFTGLPPMYVNAEQRSVEVTLRLHPDKPRTVVLSGPRQGVVVVELLGRAPGARTTEKIKASVAHILRLDASLGSFYELAASDPDLSWVAVGAGRMMRSATAFEEVVKTICTTNCSWSATTKMVNALVEHLGEPAATAPRSGARGRAFPEPDAMAAADESFYKDIVRAGYRGPYLRSLATAVASGELDLEAMGAASTDELSDDELEAQLLALPGVGPYAAAHIMMMLGRYSRLILDSWTRPTYARLIGKKKVADASVARRFKRYGPYAGLAFWLFLTKDWVEEPA